MRVKKLSVNEVYWRFNQAFGLNAMKVAARFLDLPTYDKSDPSFAEMIFENQVTGDIYSFGIDALENGTPALPFVKKKPQSRRFLAPPPLVSFSRDKHVVRTDIDRSNHVVIENFGNKPYLIKMQGILIDVEEHHYPGELLREAHRMFENPGTYKAIGDIFNDLGIHEVFFESGFEIDFVEGYVDTVKFSVNAISVEPAEFIVS